MPSYLDFNSTKAFRDELISKTLQSPDGPQSFNSSNYSVRSTNSYSNKDTGDVENNLFYKRSDLLSKTYSINRFGPESSDDYFIVDEIRTLPSLGNLKLYPYFQLENGLGRSLINALDSTNYESDTQLAKFSNKYLRDDENGPLISRVKQNFQRESVGRLRLIDALEGNTSTAINIIRGDERLIEKNYTITTQKTLTGNLGDFLSTVSGVQKPYSDIPGEYLTNPINPNFTQRVTNFLSIKERRVRNKKPTDIMYEYLGSGQKDSLHTNLRLSKYKPDYTVRGRSQQKSGIFNFISNIGQNIREFLGDDSPVGKYYIGDDRNENIGNVLYDANDNQIKGSYYLSLLFDPIQTRLLHNEKSYINGGKLEGNLTWVKNGTNVTGLETLSTKYTFREDSILAKTQELINSNTEQGELSLVHVGNAIDQTSRKFKDGEKIISKGSAVRLKSNSPNGLNGVEFCRVWTKDNAYKTYENTMKKTGLMRNFKESVITKPWDLNIVPYKTNLDTDPRKYMFSIENLAWKTSNKPGFTVSDLPRCEKGDNGGRVMWFPPYGLKFSESSTAGWEGVDFIGRPEPVYTYKNTNRTGTISFKVIVDHPSILNIMLKNITDNEAEEFLSSYFAGCETIDFNTLIKDNALDKLDSSDIDLVKQYLEYYNGKKTDIVQSRVFKNYAGEVVSNTPPPIPLSNIIIPEDRFNNDLFFNNDIPKSNDLLYSDQPYDVLYNTYITKKDKFLSDLESSLNIILSGTTTKNQADRKSMFGITTIPSNSEIPTLINNKKEELIKGFEQLTQNYNQLTTQLTQIKELIKTNKISSIDINIVSTASFPANDVYNKKLSFRRSDSIIKYIVNTLKNSTGSLRSDYWTTKKQNITTTTNDITEAFELKFKDLGYGEDNKSVININVINKGENVNLSNGTSCSSTVFNDSKLKIVSPITFFCRRSNLKIKINKIEPTLPTPVVEPAVVKPEVVIVNTEIPRRPPLDPVKKIIMKVLSECHYFERLENESPLVYNSIKEKLKYFHPSFHSITPEGLNSRLTFLHQCIRPGDTIPIKGLDGSPIDFGDARNTSFGPPPVCVLRIGDFYHSKILITSMNLSYDDASFDMNPEGIGFQPMIADVTLQVTFIGGQGLDEPIKKLQNALSFNFFANTEVYDYRSDVTVDREEYNREFLDKTFLENLYTKDTPKSITNETSNEKIINGKYLGELTANNQKLSYDKLVYSAIHHTGNYFNLFSELYNSLQENYSPYFLPLFISPLYRLTNTFQFNVNTTTTKDVNMLGDYYKSLDTVKIIDRFRDKMNIYLETVNYSELFSINVPDNLKESSEDILKTKINKLIKNFIDILYTENSFKKLEIERNKLIKDLDSLNFIVSTNGKDAIVEGDGTKAIQLSNFNVSNFYNTYINIVNLFENKHPEFTNNLDTTIDFNQPSIDNESFSKIVAFIIKNDVDIIINEYSSLGFFSQNVINSVRKRINKFLEKNEIKINKKDFKLKPINANVALSYDFTQTTLTDEEQELLKNVHSLVDNSAFRLNFSR